MSIETLTTDEFMDLEIEDHQEALAQYNGTIATLAEELTDLDPAEPAHGVLLDRMARHFTLRKVHLVRLTEMQDEAAFEAAEMAAVMAAMNGSSLPTAASK